MRHTSMSFSIHEDLSEAPSSSTIQLPSFGTLPTAASGLQYWLDTVDTTNAISTTPYWFQDIAGSLLRKRSLGSERHFEQIGELDQDHQKENRAEETFPSSVQKLRSDRRTHTTGESKYLNGIEGNEFRKVQTHLLKNLPPTQRRKRVFEEAQMADAENEKPAKGTSPLSRKRQKRRTAAQRRTPSPGYEAPLVQRPRSPEQQHAVADADATPRPIQQEEFWDAGRKQPSTSRLFSVADTASLSLSSKGSSASRSQSPTKIGMLKMSSLPTTIKSFNSPGFPTPASVVGLCNAIKDVSEHGDNVVPAFLAKYFDFEKERIRQHQIARSWAMGRWTEEETWSRIAEVAEQARECRDERLSESAWNSEVHSRVLKLALFDSWRNKGIWYRDVTTAKYDKRFAPRINTTQMASKMVDYCLVLDSPDIRQRVIQKLRSAGLLYINHTWAEYLQYSPIAVSIETKRGAVDEDNAFVQLGTWACGHFAQLEMLAGQGVTLPVLLLIIIQGDDWKLVVAEHTASGVQLLQNIPMGSTATVLGICKLIASMRAVAAHVKEVFEPWFDDNVLSGLAE